MVQQIVYNSCSVGFDYHEDVVHWVRKHEDELMEEYDENDVKELVEEPLVGEYYKDGSGPKRFKGCGISTSRDNELLADIVSRKTEYTGQINYPNSSLQVMEVPDGQSWVIDVCDGKEMVTQK